MKLAAALSAIAARLEAAGIESPRREARILLAAALRTDAAGLLGVSEVDPESFGPLVVRRAAREPMAYILGRREFWGLPFITSPATLIPRPDSETLIEAALAALPDRAAPRALLDLGTGTGCLLLAALTEFPDAFGVGVDISPAAAALAQRNAAALGLDHRAVFFAGDWAASLAGRFDLILSNPPYIPAGDLAGLMPEVVRHEPRAALDGGQDGLNAYRALISVLPTLMAADGVAVLEIGVGQADFIAALAISAGFRPKLRPDLAGCPRAVVLRK